MRKVMRIFLTIAAIIVGLLLLLVGLLFWAGKQPAVKANYFCGIAADGELEQKYTGKGCYGVSEAVFETDDERIGSYRIWYPTDLESQSGSFPLVVMANGTGVTASRYEAVFDHLASWGFVVVGNEDESAWDGVSSAKSLDFMLKLNADPESVFYQKIDTDHIGIAGHSQGGVGAINAVTAQENGGLYRAMYTASATHLVLAQALQWPYDVSNISIPYFMTAGTLSADAGDGKENVGIAPLFSLRENYAAIPDSTMKLLARRTQTDHGQMLANADGYMTAWFCWLLQGDEDAAGVFCGDSPEISENANWQDVESNIS
ncbi:MAG: alpha/beta hydrolase [Candidatus Onthomonas sp.]